MARYLAKRLTGTAIVVVIAMVFLSVLVHLVPGDPAELLLSTGGVSPDPAAVAELRERLGLDLPLMTQYGSFLAGLLQGDFGISYRTQEEVSGMILARLPATIELAAVALLISLVVAIPAGIYTGVFPQSRLARAIMFVSIAGVTLPNFVVGILLIAIFSVQLGWFPSFGSGEGFWDTIRHLILPSAALALVYVVLIGKVTRSAMVEQLGREHVEVATSRGLTQAAVVRRHVLRNAALPVLTMAGVQFGGLLGGAVVVETVFGWPGLGLLAYESLFARDINLLLGIFFISACLVVVVNLLVDLSYAIIDPRVRVR